MGQYIVTVVHKMLIIIFKVALTQPSMVSETSLKTLSGMAVQLIELQQGRVLVWPNERRPLTGASLCLLWLMAQWLEVVITSLWLLTHCTLRGTCIAIVQMGAYEKKLIQTPFEHL